MWNIQLARRDASLRLPVLIVFIFAQRQFIEGLALPVSNGVFC